MGMHAAWAAERKAALRGTRRHGGATAQHKTVTHWQPTYYTCRCKRLPFSLQKAIFYMAKGGLLQRERQPFAKRPHGMAPPTAGCRLPDRDTPAYGTCGNATGIDSCQKSMVKWPHFQHNANQNGSRNVFLQRIKIKMQPPWWRNYIEDNILNSRYYEKGKKIVLFNEKGFWQKCQKGLRTGLRQVSRT